MTDLLTAATIVANRLKTMARDPDDPAPDPDLIEDAADLGLAFMAALQNIDNSLKRIADALEARNG